MKKPEDIKKVVIAGAGTMGASMGETFAEFGYSVVLYDIFPEALEKAKKLISLNQETAVNENIISKQNSEALLKRITFSSEKDAFVNADFVVEAILENLEIKHKFWDEISKLVPVDAVICSNTSGLSITEIAKAVKNPERFCGMHWINPPHIIPLIEVIRGEKTDNKAAEIVKAVALDLNKKPVIVQDAAGFVLNRLQFAIIREALHIIESGIASPEAVDDVMKYGLGLRYACLGPLEIADLGGLDIFYNIASYLFEDLSDKKEVFGLLKECKENDRLGVKNGKGFYDYSNGRDEDIIRYRDEMFTKVAKTLFTED